MRRFVIAVACSILLLPPPVRAEGSSLTRSFTITIDGVQAQLDPGETVRIKLKDGKIVHVNLTANPYASWSSSMLTFDHPSTLTVATHKLNPNITQHLMASAIGTVVVIQEYDQTDPTALKQFMLNELAKKDIKAGSTLAQSDTKRKLASGIELSGIKGELKTGKEIKTIEVFTYGKDGRGVLPASIISDHYKATEQSILDKFWNTLALKL